MQLFQEKGFPQNRLRSCFDSHVQCDSVGVKKYLMLPLAEPLQVPAASTSAKQSTIAWVAPAPLFSTQQPSTVAKFFNDKR